jgi:hypothetical protein
MRALAAALLLSRDEHQQHACNMDLEKEACMSVLMSCGGGSWHAAGQSSSQPAGQQPQRGRCTCQDNGKIAQKDCQANGEGPWPTLVVLMYIIMT